MPTFSRSYLVCILLLSILSICTAAPPLAVASINEGADIHTADYASPTDLKPQIGPQQRSEIPSDANSGNSTQVDTTQLTINAVTTSATDSSADTADQFEPEPDTQSIDGTQTTLSEEPVETTTLHENTRPAAEELAEDAEILSEMRSRVERLLERQRALDEQLATAQRNRLSAASARASSLQRYSSLQSSHGHMAAISRERDARLASLRAELPVYFENLRELVEEAERGQREITRLRAEKRHLLMLQRRLVDEFKSRGLEHWIQDALASAVAPIVGRVVRGVDHAGHSHGMEDVKERDEMIMTGMRIDADAGRGYAFYSGIVTYLVVLLPVILVISVVVRVRRRFLRMRLGHWIVLGNVYFAVLSVGCFIASKFGHVDVLVTIQQHRFRFYEMAILAHGIVYAVHVLCHVTYALSARTGRMALHATGVSAIGVHFYMHSYRHAMKGEAADVDAMTYFIYAVAFFYILFDLVFRKVIIAALDKRSKQNLSILQSVRGVFQRAVTPRAKLIHPIPGGEMLLSNSKQHIVEVATGNVGQREGGSSGVNAVGNELRLCAGGGGVESNGGYVGVEVGDREKTGMMRSDVDRLGVVSGEDHGQLDLVAAKSL